MNISAQDVINAIFHPDDTVCLRIFDDRKEGIFTGAKMSVEAGKFFAVESTLKEHNQKNHGIFFVVNSGGQTDDSLWRWTIKLSRNSRHSSMRFRCRRLWLSEQENRCIHTGLSKRQRCPCFVPFKRH